jgi:hypothetical protein
VGAATDRHLSVPGEELAGSWSATDMTDDQERRLPPEISMSIPSERHARASDLHVRRCRRLIDFTNGQLESSEQVLACLDPARPSQRNESADLDG